MIFVAIFALIAVAAWGLHRDITATRRFIRAQDEWLRAWQAEQPTRDRMFRLVMRWARRERRRT